ncbi:hypothetical protein [Paenibacillus sedimenti]|uniref:Uncharacterized protein n=1 Tax=Paenibacillus sedimenti TaxID=2770274 RepID=A0A926KMR1_9BACL|nr:hypothetical protein [Paenibacillus sedimenti]MBD0380535.1 hypothetical protein [Paenibacillus sedimenti]
MAYVVVHPFMDDFHFIDFNSYESFPLDKKKGAAAAMILFLPIHFDANEGFITIVSIVLLLLFIALPKRIPMPVALLIMIFNSYLGRATDNILASPAPYDLYDTMDTHSYDLFDLLLYSLPYPLQGYLYVYFYDKFRLRGAYQAIHIIIWSVASIIFEAIGVWLSVFKYHGWHLSYSFPVYLLTFCLNSLLFHLAMKHNSLWKLK